MEGIEDFETHIPAEQRAEWVAWKARLRRKFQALATDCTEIMNLTPTTVINPAATDLRDRLSA